MSENVRQKIGYGIGAMGKDVVYAFVSGFILYYYNTVLGISGTFTGVMMMVCLLYTSSPTNMRRSIPALCARSIRKTAATGRL